MTTVEFHGRPYVVIGYVCCGVKGCGRRVTRALRLADAPHLVYLEIRRRPPPGSPDRSTENLEPMEWFRFVTGQFTPAACPRHGALEVDAEQIDAFVNAHQSAPVRIFVSPRR